ncbi:MAG TPA: hypothetical protein VGK01_14810 [Candidatus Angelobacter sp.]|jgi:hypothetical protein
MGADREKDKSSPLMNTDDTDLNWEIETLFAADCADERGSGGLAAQFRERPDGMNKVLKAQ